MSNQQEFNPYFLPQQQHQGVLKAPRHQRTNPITWLAGVFCGICWVIVILGGLAVLIMYLVFRPKSPRFDISSATLNAAYLDTGSLLNADLTLLTNFTNPNEKVTIDFSFMVIDLYYGNTLISTSSIQPFSAIGSESKLNSVHMVSSQVLLELKDIQQLTEQVQGNNITFYVKGSFRTRSNLGSLLHYSYWLHGQCNIVLTSPPTGVLASRQCRTKR